MSLSAETTWDEVRYYRYKNESQDTRYNCYVKNSRLLLWTHATTRSVWSTFQNTSDHCNLFQVLHLKCMPINHTMLALIFLHRKKVEAKVGALWTDECFSLNTTWMWLNAMLMWQWTEQKFLRKIRNNKPWWTTSIFLRYVYNIDGWKQLWKRCMQISDSVY